VSLLDSQHVTIYSEYQYDYGSEEILNLALISAQFRIYFQNGIGISFSVSRLLLSFVFNSVKIQFSVSHKEVLSGSNKAAFFVFGKGNHF
jgi:hypothetical protein